jgi:hypothetical protein
MNYELPLVVRSDLAGIKCRFSCVVSSGDIRVNFLVPRIDREDRAWKQCDCLGDWIEISVGIWVVKMGYFGHVRLGLIWSK